MVKFKNIETGKEVFYIKSQGGYVYYENERNELCRLGEFTFHDEYKEVK